MEDFYRQELILKLLPNKDHPIDIATITERLAIQGVKIHVRSVQRDMKELRKRFPHIRSKPSGNSKGQLWWADKALSNLSLLPTDAMNLVMIMDHARRFGMAAQVHNLAVLYEYAKSRLQVGRPAEDWSRKIVSNTRFVTLQPSTILPEVLQTLQVALLDNYSVEALYQSRSADKAKTYRLKPLGLSFQDSNIYLSCSVFGRTHTTPEAWPLHRFLQVKTICDIVEPPPGYDINSVEAQRSLINLKSDTPVQIQLRLNQNMATRLSENPLTSDQLLVQESDSHWHMQGSMHLSQGLELWLLSQGDSIEVLAPQELRDTIAKTAQRMCAWYATE